MLHTADINGLQLFYRDHGSGTPLLRLHGFMGTGDTPADSPTITRT